MSDPTFYKAPPHSVTVQGSYEPFELQVSRGQIMGHRTVTVVGFNQNVDTQWVDISAGGAIAQSGAAIQLSVSSTSADDTATGTGARTIVILGLDADYNEIQEVVTLEGLTPVFTEQFFLRTNKATVLTAGSNGGSVGDIYIGSGTVTDGVPATIYEDIIFDFNTSLTASYTIPAGYTGYLTYGRFTAAQDIGTTSITSRIRIVGPNTIPLTVALAAFNNGIAELAVPYPNAIPEKYRITAQAIGSANSNIASAYFQILLIKNDLQTA